MRSEADIRKQVEARLRRWALLVLNGILWIGAAKLIFVFSGEGSFGSFTGASALFMALWASLIGLHVLRTVYVEVREIAVRRAIEREREFYMLQEAYEKRKRDESFPRNANGSRPRIADDGELIDFPVSSDDDVEVKAKHER